MNQVRKVISTGWLVIWTVTWFTQLADPINHLTFKPVIRRLAAVSRSAKYPSVVAFCYMWEDLITTRLWPQYRVPRCFNYVFNSVMASRELYCNSQSLRCRHTALSNLSTWGLVPSRYCASLGRRDRTFRRKLLLSPNSWRTSINNAEKRAPSNE